MKRRARITLVAAVAVALPSVSTAGRFSWFDDMPVRDTLGQVRLPFLPLSRESRLTFGVEAYRSLAPSSALEEYGALAPAQNDGTVLRLYGELAPRTHDPSTPFAALHPAAPGESPEVGSSNSRLSGFGVKWQHRVDAFNTFAFSAGYSEIPWSVSTPRLDALDTRAALSWRGKWSGGWQPGVTGSLFVGDQSVRDDAYQQLGRKYFGFSVGGELRVAQDHTPYFSYRVKRNVYSPEDPAYLIAPYEDQSQVSAGWRWQVQRNWSLQAEARYGLNGANLDPYSTDRSHFFFGTRFDFR